MADTLTGRITLNVNATHAFTSDLAVAQSIVNQPTVNTIFTITNGTGLNQSDLIWSDTRSLTTASSDSLDLSGGLVDELGDTITFAKIKAIYIRNKSVVAGDDLKIGGEGTAAAWNSFFDASDTAKIVLGPNGTLLVTNPSLAGYAVTNSSNDLLKIDNPGANTVSYDIIIIGTSA